MQRHLSINAYLPDMLQMLKSATGMRLKDAKKRLKKRMSEDEVYNYSVCGVPTCLCVCVSACVRACVCECVRVCVRRCVSGCVRIIECECTIYLYWNGQLVGTPALGV